MGNATAAALSKYIDYSISGMTNNLQRLVNLANQYKQANSISTSANELVLQYLRRGRRYSGSNWPKVAGQINSGFITYVNNNANDLKGYFNDSVLIKDTITEEDVDFVHLVAVLNGLLYDTKWSDASYQSLVGESNIDNLSGWAGDLQQLVEKVIKETNNSDNYTTLYNEASKLIGTTDPKLAEKSPFRMSDLLADTDSFNIKNKLGSSSFANTFNNYYTSGNATRFKDFTQNMDKETIRSLAGNYTNDWFLYPVRKWPLLEGINVSDNQSNAVRDAYTDFIWNKVLGER